MSKRFVIRAALAASFAASLVTFGAPRAAHAGPKVKAEFLCGVYVDGDITDVLPDGKKPKLTDPVACALRIHDAAGQDGTLTVIKTMRYVLDPTTNKPTKVEGAMVTGSVEKGDDGAYKDTEAVFQPNTADDNGSIAFKTCEDFDVTAVVGDASGTFFTKTVHVAQACPKPKPVTAKLACSVTAQDGTVVPITGKAKGRYGADSTMHCVVSSKDGRFQKGLLKVVGLIQHPDDSGAPTQTTPRDADLMPLGEGGPIEYDLDFTGADWVECATSTIVVTGTDDSGATVLRQSLSFPQRCDD